MSNLSRNQILFLGCFIALIGIMVHISRLEGDVGPWVALGFGLMLVPLAVPVAAVTAYFMGTC